ncbi:MAG: hypothetical protein QM775_27575 [Pirellulales bacterium]
MSCLVTTGGRFAPAREWDAAFESLGPVTSVDAAHRELLADAAFDAVCSAFRLTARIEPAADGKIRLSVQAAALLSDDAWPRLARAGDVFLPILRAKNREGVYSDPKSVPWTMVELLDVRREEGLPPVAIAEVRSGLANPLSSRRRGRYEAWAIASGRAVGRTLLTVRSQSEGTPTADCEVFAIGAEKQARSLGRTDADGRLWIEPADGRVLRLVVAARYLPLAQIPLLPGLEPNVTVEVAGDSRLRGAEDWLTDWQTEFLDLYVRRCALMAAASIMIEKGDKPAATKLLDQIDRLGSPNERITSLEIRRRNATGGDPAAAKLIERLYDDVLATVRTLDDTATLAELRQRSGG